MDVPCSKTGTDHLGETEQDDRGCILTAECMNAFGRVIPFLRKSLSQLLFSINTEAIQYLNLALKHYHTGIISPLLWGGTKIYHEPSGGQF